MTNIREDFKNWLITVENRKASASQYIRQINKVCEKFFSGDTDEHWQKVARHILSIIMYYVECNNNEYYMSVQDAEVLENHFKTKVLKHIKPSPEYKKNIFPIAELSIQYRTKKYFFSDIPLNLLPEYISAFQVIFEQSNITNVKIDDLSQLLRLLKLKDVYNDDILPFFDKIKTIILNNPEILNDPLIYLHLKYKERPSKKELNALLTFYKYLSRKTSPKKKPFNISYDELKNLIVAVKEIYDNLMKVVVLGYFSANNAKQVGAQKGNTLYSYEVAEALECSNEAFRKIRKQGHIQPIKINSRLFNVGDVNKLLQASLYQVCYNDVDYSLSIKGKLRDHPELWCSREKASKILKRNVSTIDSYKKEKVLTYIEIVPNSAFFYVPELKKVAKILRLNPRRGLDALKNILNK